MNSTLQCILNVPRFTKSVLRQSLSPLTDALKSLLLARTFYGDQEVFEALQVILMQLGKTSKIFLKASEQQDSEEFLTFLFSAIEAETNLARKTLMKPPEKCFVDEIFEVTFSEIIHCDRYSH
jgi:ubiquitin C-terminal hydrolase